MSVEGARAYGGHAGGGGGLGRNDGVSSKDGECTHSRW